MPFCYTPWSNVDIGSRGQIKPCCKFRSESYNIDFKIQEHTLSDYVDSEFLNQIKQDFENNQWPVGCIRCRIDEENNIPSKRQLDYERWSEHYDRYNKETDGFLTTNIAFGNTCNLKCITCDATASSRWRKEYKELYNITVDHFKIEDNQKFIDELFESNLIHLEINGGEPFISEIDLQKEYLTKLINKGISKDISIHYVTNATTFPDKDWWKLWDNFKEIDMQLSADGIQEKFEYIRFPAKWKDFVQNAHKYMVFEKWTSNLRLSISHTVSAYSIFYLDEFYNWCIDVGLPEPYLGSVYNPAYMRPTVWPDKEKIINKLNQSNIKEVNNWSSLILSQDDTEYFNEFCMRTRQHDAYRNLNFNEVFPEMKIL